MKKLLAKIHFSIFGKLVLVFLITAFLIIFNVGFFVRHVVEVDPAKVFQSMLKNYCTNLAAEIGSPPDTVLAAEYAKNDGLVIRYESKDLIWSSDEEENGNNKLKEFLNKYSPDSRLRNSVVIKNLDGSMFYFDADLSDAMKNERPAIKITFLISIILILFISYLMIKRIFKPIKLLSNGVDKVKEGDLEIEVPVKSKDELGKLSSQFNQMTNEINSMIKNKEQLLYDVSHELRTPITRIRLALELMEDNPRKESISEDLRDMELMIEEILETARLKNGSNTLNISNENISDLIKEVLIRFPDELIIFENYPDNIFIDIDKERISRVIKNLIENAIKYSTKESEPIQISISKYENHISVFVKDDGIGIPEKELKNLFEPFYRVDHSRSKETGGFGLGLSLCKRIMEVHKGKISIRNNINRGITAEVQFPI